MALTVSDTSVLTKPVNAVLAQTFLRRAQQVCPYFLGSQPGTLVKNGGSASLKWRRVEQMTNSTSALTEISTAAYMQARNATAASITDVLATAAKYGQFYIINEEVDVFDPKGTEGELMATLGESAGRSLNKLMRDVMEDNATQQYASAVASTAAVHAIAITGDLNYTINVLTRNSARTFQPMTSGSTNIGTAPILPSYWGICHPDVAHDIAGMSGFTSIEKYAQQTATVPGEFGFYGRAGRGIRFVIAEDSSVDAGAGAALSGADLRATTSVTDVYTIVMYGQDAFGSVGLGMRHTDGVYRAGENTGGWEIINHPRGSGGTSDPFNEIATLAWKAFFAGAVLNSNWSRALRCAATDLSNTPT